MRRWPILMLTGLTVWLAAVWFAFVSSAIAEQPKQIYRWSFKQPIKGFEQADGIVGKALDLPGKPDASHSREPITVPAQTIPEGLTQISFTAWVKPRAFDVFNEIVRKEDGEQRLLFSFQESGTRLSIGVNVSGKYLELVAPVDPKRLTDGQWRLAAAVYDGKKLRVFLDGLEIAQRDAPGVLQYGGQTPVYLGSLNNCSEWFNGQLDEVTIYNGALTNAQIAAMYTSAGFKIDTAALREQARSNLDLAVEFMPITDDQWSKCAPEEKKRWETLKSLRSEWAPKLENGAATSAVELSQIIEQLASWVVPRPSHSSEKVGPYRKPETPPIVPVSVEQSQQALEREWLLQAGGEPTPDMCLQEIQRARQLADRIEKSYPGRVDFKAQREQLDRIEQSVPQDTQIASQRYLEIRAIKREILFSNPVIDFDQILYIDVPLPEGSERDHENHHRVGTKAVPGGRLIIQTGLSPSGSQRKLAPTDELPGSFWRPDVSFDGKRVLFCYKPCNEKAFHLYEINADGTGLRQLTDGPFDDLDPIYLPDDENLIFLTARSHTYVRCVVSANSFIVARMKLASSADAPDNSDIFLLSRNMEAEYLPSLLRDGRVIYTRWEYTDKPLWRCQSLWTMNPDGTQVQTFWGNQSVWPDVLKDARSIPGTEKVMFTGCGHHAWFQGCVGIIDPARGFNFPNGLTKVTAELKWPESGNGPTDPIESPQYQACELYTAYSSPYPLSEKDFLVSAQRAGKFVLLLMDTDGNRELIREGEYNIFHAIPLKARPKPQVRIDQVDWPTMETRFQPKPGLIYSNNVYENMPKEVQGKAKYLRIWNMEAKTYTMWDHRPYATMGPATSMVQSDGVKRILGTVPIESDGSVSFVAPSGVALHFQLLDENQRALQTMRSFTGVMPGETRGCLGCHESQIVTPNMGPRGKAMRRAPSTITPVNWPDISVSFDRYVQPVLDKYCGKCHQNQESDAYKAINLTNRPGYLFFNEPYVTLTGWPAWGKPYVAPKNPGSGFGWADTILVEGFDQRDPNAYKTPDPMTKLSYKSRLIERMSSGKHHDVKVEGDDLLRVILWVDAMCPYYGSEELRAMGDPDFPGIEWLPVKPRITTAPVIPRPGPLNAFHPERDKAYEAPDMNRVNALPSGIERVKK